MKITMRQIGLLIAIALYLGGLVGLISLTGATTTWFGFIILWYWGMVAHAKFEPIHKEIFPGILFGLLCIFLMFSANLGIWGTILIPLTVFVCSLNRWLTRIINRSTFLVLTLLTIPALSATTMLLDILTTTIITILYIGITAYVMERIKLKKSEVV